MFFLGKERDFPGIQASPSFLLFLWFFPISCMTIVNCHDSREGGCVFFVHLSLSLMIKKNRTG
jgi:hypothetical protein